MLAVLGQKIFSGFKTKIKTPVLAQLGHSGIFAHLRVSWETAWTLPGGLYVS